MLRSFSSFTPKSKTVNIILMNGGVGDHMASLVAIDYAHKTYPWITFLVWMPDFLVDFAKHVLPKKLSVSGYTEMQNSYNKDLPTKTTEWDGVFSPMKIHCLDYAFLKICDENPATEHKNYLQIRPSEIDTSRFSLPSDYVVITTGYTAKVREFPAKEVNTLSTWLNCEGVTPVFLGQTQTKTGAAYTIKGSFSDSIHYTAGINLVDKTSLLEAAKIMSGALAVTGVDNGLLHVAGCTKAPIVGGFTTVSPQIRMPVRGNLLGRDFYIVAPDKSLGCSFCQEKTNFLYGHDYKECIYNDYVCTTHMTASKFIEHLEGIL